MTSWRPDGWDARKLIPEFYDIKILEGGEWVDEKLHSLDHLSEVYAFEAGADAMLEELLSKGLKVNNLSLEHRGKGTVIFIPEEAKE